MTTASATTRSSNRTVGRFTLAEATPEDKDRVSHRGAAARALLDASRDERGGRAVELDAFADLVAEALDSLPEEFLERLENVQVDVEEWPDRRGPAGRGPVAARQAPSAGSVPRGPAHRAALRSTWPCPTEITIYQKPIEALVGEDDERIREQVRHTVIHEIAHFYGIDDDRLEELGAY